MTRSRNPFPRPLLTFAILACTVAGGAGIAQAELSEVVPGVSYERLTRPGQVYHVVRVTQGPLIGIRPVLTGGAPSRRAPLTTAMRARLGDGAVIGVNGDYFNLDNAYPSGLLMTGGEIVNEPEPTRSALIFPASGRLTSAKVELVGTWQASDPAPAPPLPERGFIAVNRPAERENETIVYTPAYGNVTPEGNRFDALITMDDPAGPGVNRPLTGVVHSVKAGGGTGIFPGMLVISGVGTAANNVQSDLTPGRRVTMSFTVAGLPADTIAAIGGGPALVQDGVALGSVSEGFTSNQIGSHTSRTAVGQKADGTALLVTAEGPAQGSHGVSMVEQAQLMASLGAQTAVGMDGGGSAAMALRDSLLVPWASERAITNAVVVSYGGVQLTEPPPFLSPNGDGVADRGRTTARVARAGTVRIALARPNGRTIRTLYNGALGPSGRHIDLNARTLKVADGRYRVIARFTPSDGSTRTIHSRDVAIDRTLGFLRIKKIGAVPKIKARVAFRIAKSTRVTAVIKNAKGGAVKLLFRNRRFAKGSWTALWDLKSHGKRVRPGIYTVIVSVQTSVGRSSLTGRVKVAKKPKPPVAPATAKATR